MTKSLWVVFCFSLNSMTAYALTLTSPVITPNGTIPTLYSCDGKDISPPLAWDKVPDHTESFALTLADPDAPQGLFFHWIVYNLPKETRQLASGVSDWPAHTVLGQNTWGTLGYKGPCPPMQTTHHYVFTLYALDALLDITENVDGKTLETRLQGHILQKSELTALFKH